mgnify:CR=1 FL=1
MYLQFFITFFAYFTDPNWYHKTRLVEDVQLSHEPFKWGWGEAKRDHFHYHRSTTVFWYKNDGPIAATLFYFQVFFFLILFAFFWFWVILFRRIYVTQEITHTYTTYCVSTLKQFFYFFLCLYLAVGTSFLITYWRMPLEFLWVMDSNSWLSNFFLIMYDYFAWLLNLPF